MTTVSADLARQYTAKRAADSERTRNLVRSGQSIGPWDEIADPERRAACRESLELFCSTYLPQTFTREFSADHRTVLAKAQKAVTQSGLFCVAMPRGSGKTSIVDATALYALLYEFRRFIAIIGSDERSACERLDSLRVELEHNDLLADDFPHVCQPIRLLEGQHNRTLRDISGEKIKLSFTAKDIDLPMSPTSPYGGGVVRVAGITGRIRGMNHKLPDGKQIRPDLVIVDDPQTDESAKSASQCADRERVLSGAVLGLAGPDKAISGIMPCTVIRPGDLADRMLDRSKHPEWDSARCKLVYTWPKRADLWERYAEIKQDTSGDPYQKHAQATEYYRANQAEMDDGAHVGWPERFDRSLHLSALQYAYDWKIRDADAFAAEAQNEPLQSDELAACLQPDDLVKRLNGLQRGQVPAECDLLTAAIDVQQDILFWCVCAWQSNTFTGHVIDYGTWPEQPQRWFQLNSLSRPLSAQYPQTSSIEEGLAAGLSDLTDSLCGRRWLNENSEDHHVARCLIDAQWSVSEPVVYRVCRASQHSSVLMPSHGMGVGPQNVPIGERKLKPGERKGLNWITKKGQKAARHVQIDTNFWKTFSAARLSVVANSTGSLMLFGKESSRGRPLEVHDHFAAQLCSEYPVPTTGRGRRVDVWALRPGADNHWWDCVCNSACAASMEGATLPGTDSTSERKKKRVSLRSLQEQRRGR